jgi:hypothetical protein
MSAQMAVWNSNNHYQLFDVNNPPELVEYVQLAARERMWHRHDGAAAHLNRPLRDVLNNTYHSRWIGRGGPTAWPPRPPDLNPLSFNLWGHLKTLVYGTLLDSEEALHHCIVDACQTIRNYPGIFARMRRSMMRHVEACTESHGGHFEHLS